MRSWRKFVTTAGLLIISGCSMKENLQKQAPIQTKETEAAYSNETSELAREVIRLSEELHLNKGVVSLGKNIRGNSMYLSINVRADVKALDLSVYSGSNPNLEKKLEGLLSERKYSSALTVLDGSDFMKTEFYDSNSNGFVSDSTDFIMLKDEKGITAITSPELIKPEYNSGYKSALNLTKRYLDSLLNKQAGRQ